MEGHRVEQAIHRIEAALNRIETASASFARNPAGNPELEARHRALREEVSATLKDLDQLIEGLEQ